MSKRGISRNAPCPCGSGKKYKLCCLKKELVDTTDLLWRRLREVDDRLSDRLLKHARDNEEDYAILDAWHEFVVFDADRDFDSNSPENQAFIPWFLFNWRPAVEMEMEMPEEEDDDSALNELPTVAESYVARYGSRLSEMEHRFIELCSNAPFSFHEILDCQPGSGFLLKDILLGREVFVNERSGSETVEKGCILFARVIQYENVGLLTGCSAILITPLYKTMIIDLRSGMRSLSETICEDDLHEWDAEIRALYLKIYDRMHASLSLTNTDGDQMCFHDLVFKIGSGQVAFERLSPLAFDSTADELLKEAEFDDSGNLKAIEFPWLVVPDKRKSSMENIVFAHIKIHDKELIVSVNSKKRAQKARAEVRKRLGPNATLLETKVTPLDLSRVSESRPEEHPADLSNSPEAQALLNRFLEKHWRDWIDGELPALGGLTPRQAMKDSDGREKVIALLDDIERIEQNRKEMRNQLPFIERTRKELGLS